ncbi:PAS domain-containing protein [Mucilaginibacter antarcticus]|uniref:PAS domain S-box protein n=1 Tax=Mucilaginibacter antarcticus TaxID=1855725 RepID=A0ABW5XNV1_9SPHI
MQEKYLFSGNFVYIDDFFIKESSNGDYDVKYRTIGAEDGTIRWVRAKGKVLFNEEDQPVRFIGSVLDITQNKSYEQELQAINEEMVTSNEELTASNVELLRTKSDLQELSNQLATSEERFRHMVQEAPVAINVLRGKDLIIESAKNMMVALIGKKWEDIKGKSY